MIFYCSSSTCLVGFSLALVDIFLFFIGCCDYFGFGVTIFNCKVSDEHVYFCMGKRKIVAGRGQSGGRVDS